MKYEIVLPPTPKAITLELLAETPDDSLEYVLVSYVLDVREHRPDAAETLPLALQAHYVASVVDGDVLNGGFNQLFFNTPELATAAPEVFEYLGLSDAASLLARACELYRKVSSSHDAARAEGTVEAFVSTYEESPFGELDRLYGEAEERWRLERIAYLRAHPNDYVHE